MGISREFGIFLGLVSLEFIFLFGPALYFRIAHRMSIHRSVILRIFPKQRSFLARLCDAGAGLSAGVFLSVLAQGLLLATYLTIVSIFGDEFYSGASSGVIDVLPTSMSVMEAILTIIINFLVIGVCEEYFFRGILFVELKKLVHNWSYLINGIIFALYHVFPGIVPISTTITYFFYFMVLGILLCILSETQQNDLFSNILAHGMFNSIPILVSFF